MLYIYNSTKEKTGFTLAMQEAAQKAFKSTEKYLKEDEPIKLSIKTGKRDDLLLKCMVVTASNKRLFAEVASSTEEYYSAVKELNDKIRSQVAKEKKKKPLVKQKENMISSSEEFAPIRKTKQIVMESITPEKAIEEAKELGHSWYVFKNSDENDMICVVYKRFDDDYGIVVCK